MTRRARSVVAAALAASLLAPAPGAATAAARAPVRVFAAASLADAFGELASAFERAHPEAVVRLELAGSQQLAAQIEQGADADVFASADARWTDALRARGALAGGARVFATNRLVVIAPRTGRVARLADLARPGVRLVIGADAVPVGRYAREALRALARRPELGEGFDARALANVVSEEDNVKGVVGKVQLGEADAGIVYRSDVTPAVARAVRVIGIPESAGPPASDWIAVLRSAPAPALARAFVALVLSPAGARVLARHGLGPAAGAS